MEVYLDNSATSWPKPPGVVEKMSDYLNNYGANPGRSGFAMAVRAAKEISETRELIAEFFNVPDSKQVIFTANATHALNIVLKGILKANDHVIISALEHNCVVRPLRLLEKEKNISITIISCDATGKINLRELENNFNSDTRAVVTLHGSNASGTILPVREIGAICKKNNTLYITDASQTVGIIPVDMTLDNISILAFTGHKKLYGPPGVGVLCLNKNIMIPSFIQGGTGSNSDSDFMPDFLPDQHEAGTKNSVGIIGLKAGMEFVKNKGITKIRSELHQLTQTFIKGLSEIRELKIYGPEIGTERLPVISFNINNMMPAEVADQLDKDFGIMVRAGLHCAPLAHKTIGSFPAGTVRFSLGCFNSNEEINYAIEAVKKISKQSVKV